MKGPSWSLKVAEENTGRWPLGLEYASTQIPTHLLFPLTNTTERARYFSFLAWVYWSYERVTSADPDIRTTKHQARWRERLENAFRTATLVYEMSNESQRGLIGRNSAQRLQGDDDDPYEIGAPAHITAWRAVYYKPAWTRLGLGRGESEGVRLYEGTPERMAKAFDESLRSASGDSGAYEALLGDSSHIPAGHVRRLAPALALRPLSEDEYRERTTLIEALFKPTWLAEWDTPRGIEARRRSRSLTLLMEMLAQTDEPITRAANVYPVLATGEFAGGRRFDVPTALGQTFGCWQRFEEREAEQFALYAFWHEVIRIVETSPDEALFGNEIAGEVTARALESEVVRDYLGSDAASARIADLLERLRSDRTTDYLEYDRRTRSLTERLIGRGYTDHAGTGLALLLHLVIQWEGRRLGSSAVERAAHEEPGPSVLSLGWLTGQFLARADQDLGSILHWIVRDLVIGQSLKVALSKPGDRFFLARDEAGYRVVRGGGVGSDFSYDASRIDAAFSLMRDLQLAVPGDGRLDLTSEGDKLRRELLDFHESAVAEEQRHAVGD
jgi:hypothetical protein